MEATQQPWQATFAILLIVLIFWLVPTLAAVLLQVPHSRDPSRRCFAWLKFALFFMTSAILLLVVGSIPVTLGTAFGLTINPSLDVALQQCRTVGYLLYQVAFVFTFPMLLDAVLAVLYDWELIESSAPLVQTITYSFVGVEVVFAIVIFIFVEANGFDYATLNSSLPGEVLPYVRLLAAFDVFLWMASVGMAFYSAFLVLLARRRPTHQKTTLLLCAASILWLMRNTWGIAADATWVLAGKPRPGTYDVVIEALVSYWAQFGCLALLGLLGLQKTVGLWMAPRHAYTRSHHTRSPYQDSLARPMMAYAGLPEPYDGISRPPVYLDRGRITTTTPAASRPGSSLASPIWPLPPLPEVHLPIGLKGGGGGARSPVSVRVSEDAPRCGRSMCRSRSQGSLFEAHQTTGVSSRRAPSTARSVDSASRNGKLRHHQSLDRFLEQNRLGVSLANQVLRLQNVYPQPGPDEVHGW